MSTRECSRVSVIDGTSALWKISPFVPANREDMVTADLRGRVILPQEIRERLGITPGTKVAVHEEDETIAIEPEDDPERIIEHVNRLGAETVPERGETPRLTTALTRLLRSIGCCSKRRSKHY